VEFLFHARPAAPTISPEALDDAVSEAHS
jgi:hypothetical protein